MRLCSWLRVLGLALCCILWLSPALAQEQPVRIVTDDRESLLYRQLLVELTAAGFMVLSESEAQEPVAVVVARSNEDAIEIQVRASGRLLLRTLESRPDRDDPRIVALRAVELLRACLREAERPVPQKPKRAAPAPPLPVYQAPPLVDLALGGALLASPGGLDSFPALEASALLWPLERWGLGIAAFWPLGEQTLTAAEGSAEVSVALLGGGLSHRVFLSSHWQLQAGVWMGAALLRTDGAASAPFGGQSDLASAFALHGSLALAYSLSDVFFLQAALRLGALLPQAEVRFAERTAAHWGSPYGAGGLALGARLF